MAELKESVGENTQQQALKNTLDKILKRAQLKFTNPLKVIYYEPDETWWISGDRRSLFYIVEVCKAKNCWREQYRTLLTICSGFYDDGCDEKEINCDVFDRSILGIVKEEIEKYADAFQATAVNISQDFAR